LEEISTKSLEFSEKLHGLLKIHGEWHWLENYLKNNTIWTQLLIFLKNQFKIL
jgi:hypothetical protein